MPVDYDAPRGREAEEIEADSLEGLQAAAADKEIDDTDDGEIVEPFELAIADISGEEFDIDVAPKGADEFTCGSCFMVMHRSMIAIDSGDGFPICKDCA